MKLWELDSGQVINAAPWLEQQPGRDGEGARKSSSYVPLLRRLIPRIRSILTTILHVCVAVILKQILDMACVSTVTPDLMLGLGAAIFGVAALVLFAVLPMTDAWIKEDDVPEHNLLENIAKLPSLRLSFDEDGFLEAFGHGVESLSNNAVGFLVGMFQSLLKSFAEPETTLFSDLTRLSEASSTFVNDVRDILSCSVPAEQAMAQSRQHLEKVRPPTSPTAFPSPKPQLIEETSASEATSASSLTLVKRKPLAVTLRRNFGTIGLSLNQTLLPNPLPSEALYNAILRSAFADSKTQPSSGDQPLVMKRRYETSRPARRSFKLATAPVTRVADVEDSSKNSQLAPASLFKDFNWLALLPKPDETQSRHSRRETSPALSPKTRDPPPIEMATMSVKKVRFSQHLIEFQEPEAGVSRAPAPAHKPAPEASLSQTSPAPSTSATPSPRVRDSDGGWFHKRTSRGFRSLRMRHTSAPVSRVELAQFLGPQDPDSDTEENTRLSFDSAPEDFSAMVVRSFYRNEFNGDSIAKSLTVEKVEPVTEEKERMGRSTVVALRKIASGDKIAQLVGKTSVGAAALTKSGSLLGKVKRHVTDASPRRLSRTRQFKEDKKEWERRFATGDPVETAKVAYVY